jgi:hypothetical protein
VGWDANVLELIWGVWEQKYFSEKQKKRPDKEQPDGQITPQEGGHARRATVQAYRGG